MNSLPSCDVLVVAGLSDSLFPRFQQWLDQAANRRLVCLGNRPSIIENPKISHFVCNTLFEVELAAQTIAQWALFLTIEAIDCVSLPWFEHFERALRSAHLRGNSLLSDGADWGKLCFANGKKNLASPFASASSLRFPKIPAVICGAGPSLKKAQEKLSSIRSSALVLCGGSALQSIQTTPHFAAAVDPHASFLTRFPKVPFCFQARTSPKMVSQAKGKKLLIPEGHFPLLNWLSDEPEGFDGGWNVATCMTALALHWGCNPIFFVGCDLSFPNEPIEAPKDWTVAHAWFLQTIASHPEVEFFNCSQKGLPFGKRTDLQAFEWPQKPIEEMIQQQLETVEMKDCSSRIKEWEAALQTPKAPLVEKLLLTPLWDLWSPLFLREIPFDPHPISFEEKIALHQTLFFEEVLKEYRS